MKNAKPKIGLLVAAALVGISQAAIAGSDVQKTFIPLENLTPQERAALEPQLKSLDQSVRIDWESVILGVNEKGELTLRNRNDVKLEMVSEPSCFSAPQ